MYKTNNRDLKRILDLIARNQEAGLRKFYATFAKKIYVTSYNICRSHDTAEEIVDDVILKILENFNLIRKIENPIGWIKVVTINQTNDVLRKHKGTIPLSEDFPDSNELLQRVENNLIFFEMMEKLTENERDILIAKIFWNETFVEIAKDLDMEVSSVSSSYYRALKKLRKKFLKK